MNYLELQKELNCDIITTVYLFIVSDRYIADSYFELIKEKLDFGETEMLNVSLFDDKKLDISLLDSSLRLMPVMAQHRLVEIKKDDLFKDSALCSYLNGYLSEPNESTVLVLYTNMAVKTNALYKKLAQTYKIVEFSYLSAEALQNWINLSFKKKGFSIEKNALSRFTELMDFEIKQSSADAGYIIRQIEKLTCAANSGKKINIDDIEKHIFASENGDLFAYTNALSAGDKSGAVKNLSALLTDKKMPQKIIASAASSFRRAALFGYLVDCGQTEATIAKKYSAHPYAVKMAVKTYKSFSKTNCLKILRELSAADTLIKSGSISPEDALYIMTRNIVAKNFTLYNAKLYDDIFNGIYHA